MLPYKSATPKNFILACVACFLAPLLAPTQMLAQGIAFISDRDGNYEIYTANADGTSPKNLTNNAAFDYNPEWSPDGSKIVFESDRAGDNEIHVMNADGSSPVNLTNDTDFDFNPHWSPEGSKILFESYRNS
ncbi:MAG: hypothetical protein O3A53_17790, partial [Acidobacteria bacterium]|nr:hypothetical protein [Acidobacteriota bacterium]